MKTTNHQYYYAHANVAVGIQSVNGKISSINPTAPIILLLNNFDISIPLYIIQFYHKYLFIRYLLGFLFFLLFLKVPDWSPGNIEGFTDAWKYERGHSY